MNWLCVIPSIRDINMGYLEPLGSTDICVIDDSNGGINKHVGPKNIKVLDYADRKKLLGANDELVPRKSPSCKGVGLYKAWVDGYDGVILLDDDVDLRVSPDYLERIPVGKEVTAITNNGPWLNTMQLLGEPDLWARGFPYGWRGHTNIQTDPRINVTSSFNAGLWCGTPDINGADKMLLHDKYGKDLADKMVTNPARLCYVSCVLQPQQWLPLSIMNVQLRRELIPAFYQPPDYPTNSGFTVRRHDDVWSCLLLKSLMDIRGDVMTAGAPIGWHRKAGDMVKECLAEHVSNLAQMWVHMAIMGAAAAVSGSYADMAIDVGRYMHAHALDNCPPAFAGIIADYGRRTAQWASMFQ